MRSYRETANLSNKVVHRILPPDTTKPRAEMIRGGVVWLGTGRRQ